MADATPDLGYIIDAMREPIRHFSALVHTLAGADARALTLFGPIVTDQFDPARHTARSVLVVSDVDLGVLRRLAEHGAKLGASAIAAPLVMTPDYIRHSLDTFPLELIEIMQQHRTVFGEDFFVDLTFEDAHVRLQCERELKAVLIGLRQGLLAAAGRKKFIEALEVDVGTGLARTLRGMLWLKGDRDAKPATEVLSAVERITDRKLPGVRSAFDPSGQHGSDEFDLLYRDVALLGEVVDGW